MADKKPMTPETFQFLKDSVGKLAEAIKVYDSIQREFGRVIGDVNIQAETSSARTLLTTIKNMIDTRVGNDKDVETIKSGLDNVANTIVKLRKVVPSDKETNEKFQSFLKQRNKDLDKLIGELKKVSGKKGSWGTKPIEFTAGEMMVMGAAYVSGMAPLGKAMQSAFEIKHRLEDAKSAVQASKMGNVPSSSDTASAVSGMSPSTATIEDATREDTKYGTFKKGNKLYEAEWKRKGEGYGGGFVKGSQQELDPLHAALVKFFNTSAMRTKWTKAVLEAVQGKGPSGDEDKKGEQKPDSILGGMLKSGLGAMLAPLLVTALPIILGTLAVAGAGMLGAAVGHLAFNWLEKKGINKKMQDWGVKHLGGGDVQDRLKQKAKDPNNDPRLNMAMKLQAEHPEMSAKEAAAQADKEWRNRPEIDLSGKVVPGSEGMRLGGDKSPFKVPTPASGKQPSSVGATAASAPGSSTQQPVTTGIDEQGFHYTQKGTIQTQAEKDADLKAEMDREKAKVAAHKQGMTLGATAAVTPQVTPVGPQTTDDTIKQQQYDTDVKRYFPKGTEGLSPDEVKQDVYETRTQELKDTIANAKAGIVDETGTSERALSEVPMDTTQANLQKEAKEAIDKLNKEMASMHQTLKDGSKNTSTKTPSGYDANNTRNPLLSSLGAGQLTASSV